MEATLDLDGKKIKIDDLRILKAQVGTPKNSKEVWRWVVNSEINGFQIIKRSKVEMTSEAEAIKDAGKNGITIDIKS